MNDSAGCHGAHRAERRRPDRPPRRPQSLRLSSLNPGEETAAVGGAGVTTRPTAEVTSASLTGGWVAWRTQSGSPNPPVVPSSVSLDRARKRREAIFPNRLAS